jgi:hypothetical protein
MNTTAIVVIVIAVVVVAAIATMVVRAAAARRGLKERYGAEYDRAIDEQGSRSAAEAELRRRVRAHDELELKELTPEETTRYRATWTELQGQFIDDPKATVQAADQLVSKLLSDRGYPVVDFDDRVAQLSVEHAGVLNAYRDGHTIAVRSDSDTASTEDLRKALVFYRELIADLLGDPTLTETSVNASSFDEQSFQQPSFQPSNATEPSLVEESSGSTFDADDTEIPTHAASAVPSTIPTVDGLPPTVADLSANEGYVEADADEAVLPNTVIPDDARDLATDADDIVSDHASSTRDRRPKASTSTNTE